MSLTRPLTRPRREPEPQQPPVPPRWGFQSFAERAAWRRQNNIVSIGPDAPPSPKPEPKRSAFSDDPVHIEHQQIVAREIADVDEHISQINQRLDTGGRGDFLEQELLAERRSLLTLRAELAADLDNPLTRDREGNPLDERMRAIIRRRTEELREYLWEAAQKAQGEGDHRRGRQLRHNALRARQIAEHEAHLRQSLRGFDYAG